MFQLYDEIGCEDESCHIRLRQSTAFGAVYPDFA